MKKWGGLTLALLVGCATGGLVRDLVLPARAQGVLGTFAYKMYTEEDLMGMGENADGKLRGLQSIERGMTVLGERGWRFAGNHNSVYIFEARAGQ